MIAQNPYQISDQIQGWIKEYIASENPTVKSFSLSWINVQVLLENKILHILQIEIAPAFRSKGYFTQMMRRLEKTNDLNMIVIEAPSNPIIREWCKKRRWEAEIPNPLHPNFVLRYSKKISVLSL